MSDECKEFISGPFSSYGICLYFPYEHRSETVSVRSNSAFFCCKYTKGYDFFKLIVDKTFEEDLDLTRTIPDVFQTE